eukprot:m.125849 g.125849  ORF g.125849 m.125849 type:complete len:263 (-) comp13812_c0_seq6:2240-3028(-)
MPRERCKYGSACYQSNRPHFKKYSHPCKHGSKCTDKTALHREMTTHDDIDEAHPTAARTTTAAASTKGGAAAVSSDASESDGGAPLAAAPSAAKKRAAKRSTSAARTSKTAKAKSGATSLKGKRVVFTVIREGSRKGERGWEHKGWFCTTFCQEFVSTSQIFDMNVDATCCHSQPQPVLLRVEFSLTCVKLLFDTMSVMFFPMSLGNISVWNSQDCQCRGIAQWRYCWWYCYKVDRLPCIWLSISCLRCQRRQSRSTRYSNS